MHAFIDGNSIIKHTLTLIYHFIYLSSYEEKAGWYTLGHAWQSVFRSYELWKHPALAQYKYMIWMDDDAFPTNSWRKDPIATMVEENLILLYHTFPARFGKSQKVIESMEVAYDQALCYIHNTNEFKGNNTGKFVVRYCTPREKEDLSLTKIGLVHGMMHITNLDVYRKPRHLKFNQALVQQKRIPYSREWDDRIAVTVPAAMEDPERAWEMRMNGFDIAIHHNGRVDGKGNLAKTFNAWWQRFNRTFPVGRDMCSHVLTFPG